jgi:LuxR family maltose regulon positive regulatory protein
VYERGVAELGVDVGARAPGPRLLNTKLSAPRPRHGGLDRKELIDAVLAESRDASVIVVEAPPGWGKSTLLASWRDASLHPARFGWFSIEASEDDPVLFWAYVVEALDRVEPGVGDEAGSLLRAQGTSVLEHVLPALLNRLDEITDPITLVLDDYHAIEDPRIHESVGFFVEHLPPLVRVIVAGRAVPPLPLARLRTQGLLHEVGVDALRFDPLEAAQLLEQETGLALEPAVVAALEAKTEGWPAGLHLAALSLRGGSDPQSLVDEFTGDHRLLADYLVSEVLDGLEPEVRAFLFDVAVLDRLSAPLCDAVRQRNDSRALLDEVERRQLFLIPLDHRREWYRFHHLFVELLRREHVRTDRDRVIALHARAAAWLRDAGFVDEALEHLFDAGDEAGAGQILAQEYMNYLVGGRREALLRWFERIPFATMRTSNILCLARAYAHLQCNRLRDAERWLEVAAAAPRSSQRHIAGFFPSFESAVALAHSGVHYYSGNVSEALRWSERAHDFDPVLEGEVFLTTTLQASAQFHNGADADAIRGFERDRIWAASVDYHMVELNASGYLAVLHARAGDLEPARARVAECRVIYSRATLGRDASRAPVELAKGLIAAHEGDDAEAVQRFRFAADLAAQGPDRLMTIVVLQAVAEAERRLGLDSDATRHQATADDLLATCRDPGRLQRERTPSVKVRRRRRRDVESELTERQIDVLRLVAQGMSNAEVAAALDVSERTVHAHLRALFDRIGARNRTAAVRYAVDHDLL